MYRKHLIQPCFALLMGVLCASSAHAVQGAQKAYEEGFQKLRKQAGFIFNQDCEQALA